MYLKQKESNLNFSYAKLFMLCVEKANLMERDITEYNKFGITIEEVNEFVAQAYQFHGIDTDNELKALQVEAFNNREAIADELRKILREFTHRISMKFGINSSVYTKFGTYDLASQSDGHLALTAAVCIKTAEMEQVVLAEAGVTEEVQNSLVVNHQEFIDSRVNHQRAICNRNAATTQRREVANELYNKLMMLCETGRVIWRERNEALANDYVIYNTPGNKPPEDTPESPPEPENS